MRKAFPVSFVGILQLKVDGFDVLTSHVLILVMYQTD